MVDTLVNKKCSLRGASKVLAAICLRGKRNEQTINFAAVGRQN